MNHYPSLGSFILFLRVGSVLLALPYRAVMADSTNAGSPSTAANAGAVSATARRLAEVEARLAHRPPQSAVAQTELHAAWREAIQGARREADGLRQQVTRLRSELEEESNRRRAAEAALGAAQDDAAAAGSMATSAAQGGRTLASAQSALREAAAARDVALERVALLEDEVASLRRNGGSGNASAEEARLRADISDRRREHTRILEAKLEDMRAERDRVARDASRMQIELSHAKDKVARLSQQDGRDSAVRDNALRERERLSDDLAEERRRAADVREENARLQAAAAAANRRAAAAEAAVAARPRAPAVAPAPSSDPRLLEQALDEALSQRDSAVALVRKLQQQQQQRDTASRMSEAEANSAEIAAWRERAERCEREAQRYRLLVADLRAKVLESRRVAFDESMRGEQSVRAAAATSQRLATENTRLRARLSKASAPSSNPPPRPASPPRPVALVADVDAGASLALLLGKQREIDTLRNAMERLRTFVEQVERFCGDAMRPRGRKRAVPGTPALVDAQVLLVNARQALDEASTAAVDVLPTGWERRQTALGIAFYVSHDHRYSTWLHPLFEGAADVMGLDPYAPYAGSASSSWPPLPPPLANDVTTSSAQDSQASRFGTVDNRISNAPAWPPKRADTSSAQVEGNQSDAVRTWEKLASTKERRRQDRSARQ